MVWRSDYTSNQVLIGICALFEVKSAYQIIDHQEAMFLNKLYTNYDPLHEM